MKLKEKADRIFSKYIRLRDSHGGYCKCCTCGVYGRVEDFDCGHYIGRGKNSVRFDEMNAHAQCRKCNRFAHGNIAEYDRFMLQKYGWRAVRELKRKALMIVKYYDSDYEEIITKYTKLIGEVER